MMAVTQPYSAIRVLQNPLFFFFLIYIHKIFFEKEGLFYLDYAEIKAKVLSTPKHFTMWLSLVPFLV